MLEGRDQGTTLHRCIDICAYIQSSFWDALTTAQEKKQVGFIMR